jgi:hypothetical protein
MFYTDFKIALWLGFVALSVQCLNSDDLVVIPVAFVLALIVHLTMDLLVHGIARRMMKNERNGGQRFTMQQAYDINHKAQQAANQPAFTEAQRHSLLLRTDPDYLWSWGDDTMPGSMAYRNKMQKIEAERLAKKQTHKSRPIDA